MGDSLSIRAIRARTLDLPLRTHVETASGTLTTAPLVLVDVLTDAGIVGNSYASIYSPLALDPLARLVENLVELLAGHHASPEAVEQTLARHFRLLGLQGLTGIAIATIDMALWDVRAKSVGRSLSALLDPGHRTRVPAYAGLGSMSPRPAAEEARTALARGFTAFKLKVGASDLAADIAAVRAVREAVGADAELMVDYNQALSIDEAIERARALEAEGVSWIEEPTRADDDAGHATIAAATTIPIQLGENWWGVRDMERSVAAGASAPVTLDAMKIGGVSGWLRAAALAERASLPVSSHAFPEVSAHLLAATPTAHRLEWVDKVGPILTRPVEIRDGQVVVSDVPGLGIEWDEQAIRLARGG